MKTKHLLPIIFLTAISFFTVSCQKEEAGPTNVSGSVQDGNGAISGAKIYLARIPKDVINDGGSTTMEEKTAGEDGSFQFNFTANEDYNYFIYAKQEQYFYDK